MIRNDLLSGYAELKEEIESACRRFFESGQYISGPEVEEFEAAYAAHCGAAHCVGVGSGLDAIHLTLRSLRIGAGDEVVVPSNTYIATWLGVTHAGANPVPAEPDPTTFNLDPAAAKQAITSRTRAILAVNLYGLPCDYDALRQLCQKHSLLFIVDNAQAAGATYRKAPVGGLAEVECHSFYPTKNLGAYGDAGAVTTNRHETAQSIRSFRNYGSRVRYYNEVLGFNSRLDALQAAILSVKLRKLPEWNRRRRQLARLYLDHLKAAPGVLLPCQPDDRQHVWHQFVIRCARRDELRSHLKEHGVLTDVHYPQPPHRSGAYASLGMAAEAFPIANQLAREVLSLPIGPQLTQDQVQQVCTLIRDFAHSLV